MAKLQKPVSSKGPVPTMDEASNNLGNTPERLRPMSFKMPESFYKDLRQFAVDKDITVTELIKRSFYHYKKAME